MNRAHRKTLAAIFARPTTASLRFSDIEAALIALGGEMDEGAGSRITVTLRGVRIHLHRPHPGKEAKRYQVEDVRAFLDRLEIRP
ncbi:MAG: type II toxin-antitoxin system HicA family toxin [Burkholderiales bacterium]|nr:type II toxin-antitoxin system HicA family toxin [Burkholderiales bacterium]